MDSWVTAENNQTFMLEHGGSEVPRSTQHNDSYQDVSLEGWLPATEKHDMNTRIQRGLVPFLRRRGQRPGGLAMAAVCLVPVLLLAQLAALYWVYEPDPAGGQDCSGTSRATARY